MNYFLTFALGWVGFGFVAGWLTILEFRIKKINLSKKNENFYFWQSVTWGYFAFVLAVVSIVKLLRKL